MALTEKLTAIADAIRVHSGKGEKLTLDQMAAEIVDLQTLNFDVVGNPQPVNPKENTIWVDTDDAITSWMFSAAEPEAAQEGMVWFFTGGASTVAFNALKKNGIQVYPMSAKQYTGGVWAERVTKSYQGGKWTDWAVYVFKDGVSRLGELYTTVAQYTKIVDGLITLSYSGYSGSWGYFPVTIDLSNHAELVVTGCQTSQTYADHNLTVSLTKSVPVARSPGNAINAADAYLRFAKSDGETTKRIDISNLSGRYYIEIAAIENGYIREIALM